MKKSFINLINETLRVEARKKEMMKRRKLIPTMATLIACLIAATLFFTVKTYSTGSLDEPQSLADIVEYPLQYSGTSSAVCDVTLTDIPCSNSLLLEFSKNDGAGWTDLTNELKAEGANFNAWPSYYGGSSDECVNFTGWVNSYTFNGSAMGGWTNSFGGPKGYNQRALLVLAFDLDSGTNMTVSAVTNLNPPDQVVLGANIADAMPYVFVNFTFWAYGFPGNAPSREVSWYYWQYSSNYNPNWFWSVYLWWRTYLKSYGLTYNAWYWWFWHWYYTEFWYFWGTSFPY
jgi:hypothetical protein